MKLYKLTNEKCVSHGTLKWGDNITHQVKKKVSNPRLCSSEVIHAYKNSNLALLLNPIHANYNPIVLWEAEGEVVVEDYGKVGCYSLTTNTQLETPAWYNNPTRVRIRFAILCAEAVIDIWAGKYPDDNRPQKAIEVAKEYLYNPTAAHAAYDAAYAAAYAADAAYDAASAASYAAHAAYDAAHAAYDATHAAYDAAIDFETLADRAVREEAK